MQFLIILVVLSGWFLVNSGIESSGEPFDLASAGLSIAGLLFVPCLAWRASSRLAACREMPTSRAPEFLILATWASACGVTLFYSELHLVVASHFGFSRFVAGSVYLLPLLGSLVTAWAVDAHGRNATAREAWQEVGLRVKLHLLGVLFPLGFFVLVGDVVAGLGITESWLAWLAYSVAFLTTLVSLPHLLTLILPSRSISDTELGKRLLVLSQNSEAKVGDVRIWDTGNRVINGLIVGMLPVNRMVFLSDRLIHDLEVDEIESVFLHELGHAKGNHMLIRFVLTVTVFLTFYGLLRTISFPEAAAFLMATTGAVFALGSVARRLEFDADRFVRQGCPGLDRTEAYRRALAKIALIHPSSLRSSWLHPGVHQRLAAIGGPSSADS